MERGADGETVARRPRIVAGVGVVLALVGLVVARQVAHSSPTSGRSTSTTSPASAASSAGPIGDVPTHLSDAELGGLRFTDVTAQAGLSSDQGAAPLKGTDGMSSAVAVADVDGDGRPDVFLTRTGKPNALFHNDGDGTFTDITAASGLGGDPTQSSTTAAFVDVNGDGAVDLVVGGRAGATLDMNDGHGHFTDQSAARGLSWPPVVPGTTGAQILGLAVGDVNGDGWLDLVVTEWDPAVFGRSALEAAGGASGACPTAAFVRSRGFPRDPGVDPNRSRLFLNDGTGHFRDATSEFGLADLDHVVAFTPQLVDLDGDGWPDLLVTGDGCTTRLFHNDGGHGFTDVTQASHLGTDENGMGAVVADVNGDGRPDIFITSIGYPTADGSCPSSGIFTGCSGNRLYLNQGDGTFADATDRYGVRNGWWGWGAAYEDFGNDGRHELAQTNGFVDSVSRPPGDPSPAAAFFARFVQDPMRFWIPTPSNGRRPLLHDAAAQVGLTDRGVAHGLVAADLFGTGRLDLLVADAGGPPHLYRNDAPSGRGWLTVRLDDPTHPGNRQALGAKVAVITSAGARPITGWIDSGGSYEGQSPPELHVGLGSARRAVDRVEVWWPGQTRATSYGPFQADHVAVISR